MIVNEGSLRSAESCSAAATAAVSSSGASSPAAMSADLPASDGSPEGCGDSQPGDSSTVLANGGIPGALNNNNNHMAVDFCKGGSRRKQSKPSRVSTADGGGPGTAGTTGRELHPEGRDAAGRSCSGGGIGGGDSSQYGVCRSVDTESPQPLSEAGDCTDAGGGAAAAAAAVQLMMPAATSSAVAATSCDADAAESGCDSVVNYPCHTCSRAFSTLLQREQHVHTEHASNGSTRGASLPAAYHHVANNLMQPSASMFNAAASAGLAKAKDVRSLLLPAMQYGLQLASGQTTPAARFSPVTTVVGSVPSASSPAVTTVASAAAGPGFSSTVFHPEAYCDICQREFCNKYFLKTHRANIHGIYASDAGVSAPGKDRDSAATAATPSPAGNGSAAAASSTPHAEGKREHASHSRDGAASAGSGGLAGFSCDICRKPFSSRLYVKKHLLNVHGIGQQAPSFAASADASPVNLAVAAAAGGAVPVTAADRRNVAWDVMSWSSAAAAMIANREFGGVRKSEPTATELLDREDAAAAAPAGSTGSDSRNSSSSASSPSGTLCYGLQPQRSPLCLTMNSSGVQSAGGGSGVYGGSASDGFGSSRIGSCNTGGTTSGGGAGLSMSPNASGRSHAAAMGLAGRHRSSDDASAAIEEGDANSDDATSEAVDGRADASGTSRPSSAGDRGSDVLAKCKETELQRMFGAAAGYMDWDDSELLRHGSIDSSRRSASAAGIGIGYSPPRKRKALESIFGYGTNGFFDAAMAVRMADRIACDICGKEVCNKYFLKAHKLKMHGVIDNAQSKRQQQQLLMQLLPAADSRSDGGDPAASGDSNSLSSGGRGGAAAIGGSSEFDASTATICADRSPSSSSSLTATPHASDMRLDAMTNASNRDSTSDGLLIKMEAPDDGPSIDGLLAMGIDPEAYCSICKKEFCSKYFLRTHKLNMHGIVADGKAIKQSARSMQAGSGSTEAALTAAGAAAAVAVPPFPGSPESGGAGTGMVVGEVYKQWRWKEPANQTRVFCDICNKELCNKYFLRTHKLNKHGIVTAPDGGQTAASGTFGIGSSPASGRQQQQLQRAGGAGSPAATLHLAAPSTTSPSPAFQQLPRGADLFGTPADGPVVADRQVQSSAACTSVAATSANVVNVGASSAIVASSRILGLKFDLDQQQQQQASEPAHADVGLQRQLSLGGRSGSSPSAAADLLLPPPSAGMPDAWSLLQIAATAGRLSSSGASASDGASGGTRSAAAASCCTCGMPFDSIEELVRHGLQAGHPVVMGNVLDLQQGVPYGVLQRELSMLPDTSAAQLRRMSLAFLMGNGGGSHGRAHSNKSASVAGGEKLYSCSRCDYKTPWLSNIYSHEQRKHGGGTGSSGTRGRGSGEVHTCGVCLRTFSYEHSLMRHVTEYHGGVGLPQSQLQQNHAAAAQAPGASAANITPQPSLSGSGPSEAKTDHEGDGTVTSASEHSACSSAATAAATTANSQLELPPASPGSRTIGGVAAHSATVAVTQKRRSRCPYCSKQFINKYLCQSHIRHVHGVCTAAGTAAPSDHAAAMYACSMCKFTCRVLSNLRMHQAIKHKLPPPHDAAWGDAGGLGYAGGADGESAVEGGELQQQKHGDGHTQRLLRRSDADGSEVDDAGPNRTDDNGRPVVMQPFRIVGVSGADHFAPATVYLPVYRPVAGESLVTFTLRSVEN